MIIAKLGLFAIGLAVEYRVIQTVLEYFDNKKYAEQDADYERIMQSLKAMNKKEKDVA